MSTSAPMGWRFLAGIFAGVLALAGLIVSPGTAGAASTDRLAGDNRYETAGEIANATYPEGVTDVILATGRNYPDALAASGLAGQIQAPVLLTDPDTLSPETEAALAALGPQRVHIAGGLSAVSEDIEAALQAAGYETARFDGDNRYDTAAMIALEIGAENIAEQTAIIATGRNFPDALAGGPLAFASPHPVLLVHDDVPDETREALVDLGINEVVILGQTSAVSAEVEDALSDITGDQSIERLGGARRAETAAEIAGHAVTQAGFDLGTVLIANGWQNLGVDALAGGPYGGAIGAPILLVQEGDVPPGTSAFLTANASHIDRVVALGGPDVIDPDTLNEAAAAATAEAQGFDLTLSWINELTADGENVVYRQGEPGADGTVRLTLDPENDTISYDLDYSEVTGPFTAAPGFHIHAGAVDENGDVVVPLATGEELEADDDQMLQGTVTEEDVGELASIIDDILANPSGYYVNLHSDDYPAGAIRGQLPDGGQDEIPAATGVGVDVVDTEADAFDADGTTYSYDEDDTFLIGGNESTYEQFDEALSPGDTVTVVDYQPGGTSTFDLVDDVAAAPSDLTATVAALGEDGTANDVTFAWTASTSGLIDAYTVNIDFDCDGDVDDSVTTSGDSLTAEARDLADGDHCAVVTGTTVAGANETSASNQATFTVATPVAPTITSAVLANDNVPTGGVNGGDIWLLTFTEAMASADVTTWTFDMEDANEDAFRIACTDFANGADAVTDVTCQLEGGDVLRVVVLEASPYDRNVEGDGEFTYPVTITAAGESVVDADDGASVDIGNSADVTIEVDAG